MATTHRKIKLTVAFLLATVTFSLPAVSTAQEGEPDLLAQLRAAETEAAAERLERQIFDLWSKSGSAARDLLLQRGRDAIEVEDWEAAFEHLRALTDHAPEFAEGWHTLALVYFNTERLGLAMDALERALTLNPDHFGALRGVGAVHEQTGNRALAYAAYERVLEMRPHDSDVQKALDRLEREVRGTSL